MAGRISLKQQIALLSETAPTDFDPEDIHPENAPSDEEPHEADSRAARAHYVDVGPSTLRLRTQSIADPKYEGRRVSRKQLFQDENAEDEDEDGDDDVRSQNGGSDGEPPEGSESGSEDAGEEAEALSEEDEVPSRVRFQEPPSRSASPTPRKPAKRPPEEPQEQTENQDLASTLRATREQDRKKGKAVAQQISLWDTLLDARIRLQKAASAVNKLPPPQNFSDDPSAQDSLNAMLNEAIALSEDLFALQETLLHTDDPAAPARKRAKLTPSPSPSPAASLVALSRAASAHEAAHHAHLVQTLRKWSAKVQAVARGSFKSAMRGGAGAGAAGVVDVIDETLRADGEKLLVRTRAARRGGGGDDDASDDNEDNNAQGRTAAEAEVFDDTDFYQQLLRDVIAARGGDGADGEQEWVRAQKARKARRRRTVDTRASKGRKLRYEVHERLQNFMVPVPPPARGAWHEEQVDELFASLLGSGQ